MPTGGEGSTGGGGDETAGERLLECNKWLGRDDLVIVEVEVVVEEEVEVETVLVREPVDKAPLGESRSLLYSR